MGEGVDQMYRVGILEKDEAYLNRLIGFLRKHHSDSFEITAIDAGRADRNSLGLELGHYDAIFIGDGIEKGDDIPTDITLGFITEKEATGENDINKYQSLEMIYNRMMRLCESSAAQSEQAGREKEQTVAMEEAGYDLGVETVTENGVTCRVYHIKEKDADKLAVMMIASNHIKGLFPMNYHDEKLMLDITDKISLYDFVRENNTPKGKQDFLKLFEGIIATAVSLEEYMLSVDRLVLDPREIYVDTASCEVMIPYLPICNDDQRDARQCIGSIGRLCALLLEEPGKEKTGKTDESHTADHSANEDDEYGGTETFDNLQKNAQESLKLKNKTRELEHEKVAYIIRKSTNEKILINRNIFKLGKDAAYVDYCIKNNPTVSRNHADIVRKADGYYLVDKGSLNHTFVDGKKLEPDEYRKLKNGCLFQLANEVFQFGYKRI